MRLRHLIVAMVLLAAAGGPLAAGVDAADPAGGTVDAARPEVTWTGGPMPFTTIGTGCEVPQTPTCDVFELTVGPLAPKAPDVLVAGSAADAGDVLSLYVYGPDGTLVESDTNLTANPRVTLRSPTPGAYSVRFEALLSQTGSVSYSARATAHRAGPPPDPEVPCNGVDEGLGPPPQEIVQAIADDDGGNVDIDVLVFLDGVGEGFARGFFEKVAVPYARIGLTVKPTFRPVPPGAITSDVTTEIIDQTKDLLPGRRVPDQFDVVELLTNRNIEALGIDAVAGQAECIGGAAHKQHSFNVSEAQEHIDQAGVAFGPLTLVPDVAAKITAHEIGHLYGGQHHYANCAEGADPALVLAGDSSPCTLMFNSADFIALRFGTVNARIMRGYAVLHSAANDPG